MGFNFRGADRDQGFLLPPDMRDWLAADHLAWFVIDTVGELDLSAFEAAYRADGHGGAAYDPAVMVALLAYANCVKVRASRRIEAACRTDVAFRVVAANTTPDHATIARFRARHEQALAGLFTQVLALCDRAGLVRAGLVAIDGTKIAADASMAANLDRATLEKLAQQWLAEAAEADAADDAALGEARGDELPDGWGRPEGRRARIRAALDALDEADAASQASFEAHQAEVAERSQRRGRPPKKTSRRHRAKRTTVNLTDVDSRVMKAKGGYLQGYNAQAVTGPNGIVLAAAATTAGNDVTELWSMVDHAAANLAAVGVTDPLRWVVADAGYYSEANLTARPEGPILIVPTASRRRKTDSPAADAAEIRRASWLGRHMYRRRAHMAESLFGNHKHNRDFRRFSRRGHAAADAEWQWENTLHNLLKLFTTTSHPPALT